MLTLLWDGGRQGRHSNLYPLGFCSFPLAFLNNGSRAGARYSLQRCNVGLQQCTRPTVRPARPEPSFSTRRQGSDVTDYSPAAVPDTPATSWLHNCESPSLIPSPSFAHPPPQSPTSDLVLEEQRQHHPSTNKGPDWRTRRTSTRALSTDKPQSWKNCSPDRSHSGFKST